jgi:hypothetical protein
LTTVVHVQFAARPDASFKVEEEVDMASYGNDSTFSYVRGAAVSSGHGPPRGPGAAIDVFAPLDDPASPELPGGGDSFFLPIISRRQTKLLRIILSLAKLYSECRHALTAFLVIFYIIRGIDTEKNVKVWQHQ